MAAPRLFGQHFQTAYVTNDMDQARQVFADEYAVKDFFFMQNQMEVTTPSGVELCELKIAMANVDGLQVELIEPVSGAGSRLYSEVLPASGFGMVFHHLGFLLPGLDDEALWQEFRSQVGNARYPIAIEGDMGVARFLYLDTRRDLGHYSEYIWQKQDLFGAVPNN